MAVAVANTLDFLIGRWSIDRVITDHHDARTVRFSGHAEVAGAGRAATYVERGQVSTAAHAGPAGRTLRLSELEDGTVRVDFQNGLPFHGLDLSHGSARATHPCRADSYEMSFEVRGPDELVERWRVTGPAKDYEAETVWRRC